jgi:hypothetical protein
MAKFTVKDMAKKLGVKPATARGILRKKGSKRKAKSYGWNTLAELNAEAKKLQGATAA